MQTKRPDLLIVHQGAELYGSDQMLCYLLKILHNQNYRITLHVPHDGLLVSHVRNDIDRLVIEPISILRLAALKKLSWLNPFRFIKNLINAHKQLQQHDMVILNTSIILSYLLLLPFYNKKKFTYVHELPTGAIKLVLNLLLYLSRADLICNSQATMQAYPLIKQKKKHLLYNVTELQNTADKDTSGDIHLLQIGRVSPRKGQLVLLQALNLLSETDRQRIKLHIVGDMFDPTHSYQIEIQQEAQSLGDSLTFFPFQTKPQSFYQWAHIVIVPSLQPESFGLVALEAMQHGCAVIASDIGALPEVVSDNVTGRLVETNSAPALSRAIQFYLDNPHMIREHAQNGQKQAQDKFSPDLYNRQLNAILEDDA